jgi:hypothetical protein
MTAQQDNLTPGERQFLERMQEARKEGVSLQDYFRSHGLSLPAMYAVRSRLIQKGRLPSARAKRSGAETPNTPGPFAAVRVAPPAAIAGQGRGGCRLRSPGGWVIECDGLPEISWVERLMGVQS